MRYLKYNEELKPATYKSAADKLTKLGHHTRASILHKHSEDTLNKNAIIDWEKKVEMYSKYGKIKVLIEKDGVRSEEEVYFCFYPYLEPYKDDTRFLTSKLDWKIEETPIYFEMWVIPQTREQFDRMYGLLKPDYY